MLQVEPATVNYSRRFLGRALVLNFCFVIAVASSRGAESLQVISDQIAYNAGSAVNLEIVFPNGQEVQPNSDFLITLRYVGDPKPVLDHAALGETVITTGSKYSTGFRKLWEIPANARTGRYEVDLLRVEQLTQQVTGEQRGAASFSVYRKLVEVSRINLDKTFYTSGDHIGCIVTLLNLTDHPLKDLRVEFSDRYWPWIAEPAASVASTIKPLSEDFSLLAGQKSQLAVPNCAVAREVEKPAVHQYGVVVWDHERKNVYEISFSPTVFISPRGATASTPYPQQYIYSDLGDVDTESYRQFYPSQFNSAAIQFDHAHTMFPTGGEAVVRFTLSNSTDAPWRGVSAVTRWVSQDGRELARNVSDKTFDLIPGADPLPWSSTFHLPTDAGLYRARVQVTNTFGQVLAMNDLEVAANPLPQSILIFCAHEDDEGGWSGLIRAAVENNIPLHFVYFTSGDAGSCDRYYQHSCSPSEALRFGTVRMNETRTTLGHLGVPPENIFFLGLPDGGSGQIWYDHPDPSQPYLSVLLASDHSPYAEAARPNLPYARQSVVDMVKAYVKRFQPEVIVTAHPPNQSHIDHIVNNYFVVKGLEELLRDKAISPELKVLVDRIYDPKSVPQTPYQYAEREFFVTGDAMALAQEAGWFYQSQGGNRAQGNIRVFEKLPRSQPYREVLDWKDHEGWNETRSASESPEQ